MFNRILNDHVSSVCMMLLYVYFYSYVNVIVDLRLNKVYVRSFVRSFDIHEKKKKKKKKKKNNKQALIKITLISRSCLI